jgi:hypothetical protein
MYFRDKTHEQYFQDTVSNTVTNKKFITAIYLLTADYGLWNQVKSFVFVKTINFEKMSPTNLEPEGYFLYKAAQDIYLKTNNISFADLCEKHLTRKWQVEVVCQAIWARRYGIECGKER